MARTTRSAKRPVLKVRSGDEVQVMAGKDRGKSGRILRVELANERVYVEGLNMVKRHMRPQQVGDSRQAVGGVIEREGPIHVSNVMLLDPKDHKPTRVGIEREDGKRYRVAKRSGTRLD
ncbi:MAG TPA: 50S ribosomal protein L24 [Solirubrobacteraceae bacterium]|jgi:large subunit ribosomal protein L24|nr:50S ribosomal protein L24 [Solirubrobacteraceae bacterium]